MASNKILRVNEDIRRVLSALLRDMKDPRLQQGMLSITEVDTTGDLRFAKVYISVLGQADEKEEKDMWITMSRKEAAVNYLKCMGTGALCMGILLFLMLR